MIIIILSITELIVLLSFYYNYYSCEKPNGNLLLGVTLPKEQIDNIEVSAVVKQYHKANLIWLLMSVIIYLPCIALCKYISLLMIYYIFYTILIYYVFNRLYIKYFNKLYAIKKQNKWYVGKTHIVNIDTEASRLKSTFPVSRIWFILSFIIAILPFLIQPFNRLLLVFPLSAGFICVLCVVLHIAICKTGNVVYSENSSINTAINCVFKREWTRCFVLLAYINSITATFMYLLVGREISYLNYIFIPIIIESLFTLSAIINAYLKVRRAKQLCLLQNEAPIYYDDDVYWEKGYYYNADDTHILVDKRVGIGMDMNMARPFSKILSVLIIAVIAYVLWLGISFIPLDFGKIDIIVTSSTVTINAPMYPYSFELSNVESVTQLNAFPPSYRTNGAGGKRFAIGNFDVKGYGQSKVYVNNANKNVLYIKLKNENVFLNAPTNGETEALLNKISP
ncbi:MAG: PH domain-containing protein [Oscillospiraceae bacterium]